MPRLPIDYSKTIIYKICCNDVNIKEVYVGHTTDLTRRRQQHKENCNNEKRKEYNQYKYQFIRENGGWENWSLVPVEEFSCENVNQATIRERYWFERLEASLNIKVPSRNKIEYQKEYRRENYDEYKDKEKKYYQNNKQIISEKQKNYYENNKQIISEKAQKKIVCECGSIYHYGNKSCHFKTKKHQDYLSTVINTSQESSP